MTRRSLWRRAAPRIAGATLIGMTILIAGCRWVPVRRIDQALDPRELGPVNFPDSTARAEHIETQSVGEPLSLPPLPADHPSDRSQRLASGSTPLLDEALVRAEALQQARAETVASDFPILSPTSAPVADEPVPPGSPTAPAPFIAPHELPPPEDAGDVPAPAHADPAAQAALLRPVVSPPTFAPNAFGPASDRIGLGPDVLRNEASTPSPGDTPRPSSSPEAYDMLAEERDGDVASWSGTLQELRAMARELAQAEGPEQDLWLARAEVLDRLIRDGGADDDTSQATLETVMALLAGPSGTEPTTVDEESTTEASSPDEPAKGQGEESPVPQLAVSELRFCREVRGFGDFVPEPLPLHPAQVVTLYCEMEGVTYQGDGDGFRSRLEADIEILLEEESPPIWRYSLGGAEDICRRPRRDYYVNYRFSLPTADVLGAGSYLLRLKQRDILSGTTTSACFPFTVVSP